MLVAQPIRQINCPSPCCYLTWTAHASILSSSASISLSVTACLFIQLELSESLELPWCVSVPAGRDLCVQCLSRSKFWLILSPSMVSKCSYNRLCPSLSEEDINALSAATWIAVIPPPFPFFSLTTLCLCVCLFLLQHVNPVCFCESLSACAWPPLPSETFHAT